MEKTVNNNHIPKNLNMIKLYEVNVMADFIIQKKDHEKNMSSLLVG